MQVLRCRLRRSLRPDVRDAAALVLSLHAEASPVFDAQVHLWNGEKSLRTYEEQRKAGGLNVVGFGGMWFGGPNQALARDPERIRSSNDGVIVLAAKGIKVLKLHPHTQKFDPADCEKLFNLGLNAPKTTFIFAHLGGMNFRFWNILTAARTIRNTRSSRM